MCFINFGKWTFLFFPADSHISLTLLHFPRKGSISFGFLVLALLLWRMDREERGVYVTTQANKLAITLSSLWFIQRQRKREFERRCVWVLFYFCSWGLGMAFSPSCSGTQGAPPGTVPAGGVGQVRDNNSFLCSSFSFSLALLNVHKAQT